MTEKPWPLNISLEQCRDLIARHLAGLEDGEDWPTNEALGGSLTGTRDDEYRDGIYEQADELIAHIRAHA